MRLPRRLGRPCCRLYAAATLPAVSSQAVLSRRALNRALLSRQLLLDRVDLPDEAGRPGGAVIQAIEHLIGLQAQAPFPPYYGLWSRLGGFRPEDLAALLTDRRAVRIALMRGTIHLVSARDCLPLRRLVQPVLERGTARRLRQTTGRGRPGGRGRGRAGAGGIRTDDVQPARRRACRALAGPPSGRARPGGTGLRPAGTGTAARRLGPRRAVGAYVGGALARPGGPAGPPPAPADLAVLVTRYLAAFGPATVRDVQAWSGLTGLRSVMDQLRPSVVTFRDSKVRSCSTCPWRRAPPGRCPRPSA